MVDIEQLGRRSKAASWALIFGVISLLTGPLLGFIGLIIRLLKVMRFIYFEGTFGIGGLAGTLGLLFGLLFGLIGLIFGISALGKVRKGTAPPGDKRRTAIGIGLSVISATLAILIFIIVLFTLETNLSYLLKRLFETGD